MLAIYMSDKEIEEIQEKIKLDLENEEIYSYLEKNLNEYLENQNYLRSEI